MVLEGDVEKMKGLFHFLDDSQAAYFKELLQFQSLAEGEFLFNENEIADKLFFVISGRFAVKRRSDFEDKKQVVAIMDRGAIIGEGSLIDNSKRTGDVVAIEDSEVAFVERKKMSSLVSDSPDLAVKVYAYCLKICSRRLQLCTERLAHIL